MQQLFGVCHSVLPSVQKKVLSCKSQTLAICSPPLFKNMDFYWERPAIWIVLLFYLIDGCLSLIWNVYLSLMLQSKILISVRNKWNANRRWGVGFGERLETGLIWFSKEDSTLRQTPSASECLSCRWSRHCQGRQGRWTSHLGRWIFHVHWRPPRLNLSSLLACPDLCSLYVDCNAIHMSKLPFSYAWAEAHTAADRQLSVCVCVHVWEEVWGMDVYMCVCFSSCIIVRTIFEF